jgi:hypothetical protein
VTIALRPQSETGYAFELPPVRVAALEAGWLPVVSGLNPKTTYDMSDLVEDPLPDDMIDLLVPRSGDPRVPAWPPAEAREMLRSRQAQGRERQYTTWLHDLRYRQSLLRNERVLDHPAIAANVAILRDQGQTTLDACRSYLEGWLRPLVGTGAEIRLSAERQMTETFHVGKLKKSGSATSLLADKAWARLFDEHNDYQAIVVEFIREGAEFPFAGMGLHGSLRRRGAGAGASGDPDAEWSEYHARLLALTLGKMRGRSVADVTSGHTLHVFDWIINHDDCHRYLGTSIDDMKTALDVFATDYSPLQAWHGQSTWIPRFDRADSYEGTIYEEMSVLNFFPGILLEQQFGLKDQRMTAQWCSNVLRMVTPHMWLCGDLMAQLDPITLDRVAIVSAQGGCSKIEKRPDCAIDDFELALMPILPIESARITVRPSA